jgi:hypothetical protein
MSMHFSQEAHTQLCQYRSRISCSVRAKRSRVGSSSNCWLRNPGPLHGRGMHQTSRQPAHGAASSTCVARTMLYCLCRLVTYQQHVVLPLQVRPTRTGTWETRSWWWRSR